MPVDFRKKAPLAVQDVNGDEMTVTACTPDYWPEQLTEQ